MSRVSNMAGNPRMTDGEYEDLYREALLCLGQILEVGSPYRTPDGTRVCSVDRVLLDDGQVLERWWGKSLARKIKGQRRVRGQSGLP